MYHYVYLLEFDDGMAYVGLHSTVIKPELDVCYLGSGKALPPRSPKTCTKTIIKIFDNRQDAHEYECDLIKEWDCVKSPLFYNLRHKTHDKHGSSLSAEHRQMISERQLGRKRPEYGKKYSGAGRTPAQRDGDRRAGEKTRGTKNPAKGLSGTDNNGFKPWYSISPSGVYTEYLNETKQDVAALLGVTPRQLIHRFHYTNEHRVCRVKSLKGWAFGNLPRPQTAED